jgi:hypothetical protein
VSLEFNTMTLQPTYRLCWGAAGSSNALDIATALGFDAAILADARILARAEASKQEQQQGRMEQVGGWVRVCFEGRGRLLALPGSMLEREGCHCQCLAWVGVQQRLPLTRLRLHQSLCGNVSR